MANVAISGDTSGAVTLTVPATAGTQTVTFPAATGTAMVSGNMPAFSAYKSTDQTGITSNTYTKITFDVETFDTNNNFASSRFTPTVAGYYQITTQFLPVGTAMTNQTIAVYKNGNGIIETYFRITANDITVPQSILVYCNGTTDYLEVYGKLTASSGIAFAGGSIDCFFSGVLVRTA